MDNYEHLEGRVMAVVFSNVNNGYTVLRLAAGEDADSVTVVGTIPYAAPGEYFELYGVWETHRSYGQQFHALRFERWMPQEPDDIADYLSSGILDGVGPATARRIVETFGAESLDILLSEPERLTRIRGFTESRALKIGEQFRSRMALRRMLEFAAENGLSQEIGLRIYRRYGEAALSMIEDNPYLLVDPYFGVSFTAADDFARSMGLADDAPQRFDAAVKFVLLHNMSNGHVFLPTDKLLMTASAMLELGDTVYMEHALARLCEAGEVVRETLGNLDTCYLADMHEAECFCAQAVARLAKRPGRTIPESRIDAAQKRSGIGYDERQREAIRLGTTKPLMVLTGGPGTGKTTTVRAILDVAQDAGLDVVLAAPTGRAAKRLGELCGQQAQTLHRLLEMQYSEESAVCDFAKDEDDPIDADLVIVDELSMVDLSLFAALLRALPMHCSLVLVGDPDQLPAVGAGNVLKDLIACGCVPVVKLETIFRQAQRSRIVLAAHEVNEGKLPPLKSEGDFFYMKRMNPADVASTVVELCAKRLPSYFKIDPSQIQVICPSKKREAGTAALNRALQDALNPAGPDKPELSFGDRVFRQGDRVMQMRNNYTLMLTYLDGREMSAGVFNGDIGVITQIDPQTQYVRVRFDDEREAAYEPEILGELELAYAVTVHKAQGSEFPVTVLALSEADRRLLSRNLLYTAITRARSQLVIVGNDEVFKKMVDNNVQHKRYSALHYRIRAIFNAG